MHCLLGLFLFGTVLQGLLVGSRLGFASSWSCCWVDLIAAEVQVAQVDEVDVASREVHWVSGSGPACSSTCLEEVALFWVFWYLRC